MSNINDSNGDLSAPASRGTLSADFGNGSVAIEYRDSDAERRSVQMHETDLSRSMQSIAPEMKAALDQIAQFSNPDGSVRVDHYGRPFTRELALARQRATLLQQNYLYQQQQDAHIAAEESAKAATAAAWDAEASNLARIASYRNHVRAELAARGVARQVIDEISQTITLDDVPANY